MILGTWNMLKKISDNRMDRWMDGWGHGWQRNGSFASVESQAFALPDSPTMFLFLLVTLFLKAPRSWRRG